MCLTVAYFLIKTQYIVISCKIITYCGVGQVFYWRFAVIYHAAFWCMSTSL